MSTLTQAFRHRIQLQQYVETVVLGNVTGEWVNWPLNVSNDPTLLPAAWLPGPGREFLAAEALRAETSGRLVIRYMPGVEAEMRVLWDGMVWDIKAVLPDPTRRREITLMVSQGANQG